MMTLLPIAAFAAADRFASTLSVDKTKVEASGDKAVKFTVYVREADYDKSTDAVYIASERTTSDKFEVTVGENVSYFKANGSAGTSDDYAFIGVEPKDGKVEFKMTSTVAGDAVVAVGLLPEGEFKDNNIYKYLVDSNVTAAQAKVIGTKTITFQATSVENILPVNVKTRGKDVPINLTKKPNGNYPTEYTLPSDLVEEVKANNSDYYEVTFQVVNKVGAPVEGEDVEFSTNKSNAKLNKSEATTDEIGQVKVRVYAEKSGNYELQARAGNTTFKLVLNFTPSSIDNFEVVKELPEKIAYNKSAPANFRIQLKDGNGNNFDLADSAAAKALVSDDDIRFEWKTKPSDSDLGDDEFKNESSLISEDNGQLKVTLPKLDAEGKYVLRVSLANGKTHEFAFEAKEQGKIVRITFSYDQKTLALGATTGTPSVKRIDAEGVEYDATKSDLDFTVNDYKLVAAGWDIDANDGKVKATDNDDYTGTLVVTVVDTKEDLSASTEIVIADTAVGFDLVPQADVFPVGGEGKVSLVMKDRKGNNVAIGDDADIIDVDYFVISKPEGAQVSVEESSQFAKQLKQKGESTLSVFSNKAGEAEITIVLDYTVQEDKEVWKQVGETWKWVNEPQTVAKKMSSTVKVNFGEPKEEVIYGAKNVTMFIGSTGFVADGTAGTMDQAPFIQDNRTFVPLRAVATALGATNEDTMWDPATQTITLVRPDLTATMTIGNNVITLSNGQTVVADVAPFIVAETGRTVIPFRAIAEAFGADVEAVFGADGTTTAVTFTQE